MAYAERAARGAVDDQLGGPVGGGGVDPRLEVAAGDALRPGQMSGRELFAAADVDDRHALADQLLDLGGVDLLDLALDSAKKLRAGRTHLKNS